MKRTLQIDIECEQDTCGECEYINEFVEDHEDINAVNAVCLIFDEIKLDKLGKHIYTRCDACKEADWTYKPHSGHCDICKKELYSDGIREINNHTGEVKLYCKKCLKVENE